MYINTYISNTIAFLVHIAADKTEQDCTSVYRSSKIHKFKYHLRWVGYNLIINRFATEVEKETVRKYSCVCAQCINENYYICTNVNYVRVFVHCNMQTLGLHLLNACYNPTEADLQHRMILK